ncbi:unnamed protein product, partial [Protopolystoma xenopodis]
MQERERRALERYQHSPGYKSIHAEPVINPKLHSALSLSPLSRPPSCEASICNSEDSLTSDQVALLNAMHLVDSSDRRVELIALEERPIPDGELARYHQESAKYPSLKKSEAEPVNEKASIEIYEESTDIHDSPKNSCLSGHLSALCNHSISFIVSPLMDKFTHKTADCQPMDQSHFSSGPGDEILLLDSEPLPNQPKARPIQLNIKSVESDLLSAGSKLIARDHLLTGSLAEHKSICLNISGSVNSIDTIILGPKPIFTNTAPSLTRHTSVVHSSVESSTSSTIGPTDTLADMSISLSSVADFNLCSQIGRLRQHILASPPTTYPSATSSSSVFSSLSDFHRSQSTNKLTDHLAGLPGD